MARQLRDSTPGKVHLLTSRTRGSELLFVPTPEITNCIGGVIARYAQRFNIDLYAAIVLSNHYHILASAPHGNLHLFAENIGREITKRVNRLIQREGSIWGRRYDGQIVPEEYDALEGLLYILTNPTKHSLVFNSKNWPGLTTYKQSVFGKTQKFTFTNYTKLNDAKRAAKRSNQIVRRSDYEIEHELKMKPIPIHQDLTETERLSLTGELLEKRHRKLQRETKLKNGKFLGKRAILSQRRIGVYPKKSSRSKRPKCYTKSLSALKLFIEENRERLAAYITASIAYRSGKRDVSFPEYCFLPPCHHKPREYLLVHS